MIEKVLLASDGTESWDAAAAVTEFAVASGAPVEVKVLHVNDVEYRTPPPGAETTDVSPGERRLVEQLVADLRERGLRAHGKVRSGLYDDIADDIVAEANEYGAHLIVMGSRRRSGFRAWLMGSVSNGVIRRAKCPVVVVPGCRTSG